VDTSGYEIFNVDSYERNAGCVVSRLLLQQHAETSWRATKRGMDHFPRLCTSEKESKFVYI